MSYKLTCPSCDTYTSANFRAYESGRPCPGCGSSLQSASTQYYRQLPTTPRSERGVVMDDFDDDDENYCPCGGCADMDAAKDDAG